jgi:hypothetical protein
MSGQGAGILSAVRQLGIALGIALLTTVFYTTLGAVLRDSLTAAGTPAAQAGDLSHTVTRSAGAVIPSLAAKPQTQHIARAANHALSQGISSASYVAAPVLLLGLAATLLIPAKSSAQHQPSATAATSPRSVGRRPSGE